MLRAQYLENGCRYRLGFSGPPIGNGLLRFEWSRDPERSLGQGHDPDIFGAQYLENGLGANGAPIGNGYLEIKWSRDR